jgi:two-component sensor histidine kinase
MPFIDIQSSRVELNGPDIVVTAEAAQAIGLAIHELATNAIKYGALSVPAGKVKISWAFDSEVPSRQLLLKWVERGGPRVVPPSRNGFGHLVIGEMIERSLNARRRLGLRLALNSVIFESHSVRFGSNPENLNASICFPLFIQQRTCVGGNNVGLMRVRYTGPQKFA